MRAILFVGGLALCCGAAAAQGAPAGEAAPPPKPAFVPGQYHSESRNSAFPDQPAIGDTCINSADFDAFERETIAQYRASPAFNETCKLSDPKPLPDGFAMAMDCTGDRTILTYRFSKDLVAETQENLIIARPEYSSKILTLSRRTGACPGQPAGKPL